MINLAVVFGGESCEHDISIITGLQLISKVNKYLYNIVPIYIDKNGNWKTGDCLKDLDNYPNNLNKLKDVAIIPNDQTLYLKKRNKLKPMFNIDVAILCLHGVNGEDGNVAGILNLSKIPYSSGDILSSSVCIDKIVFNDLCKGLNVPKVEYIRVLKSEYLQDSNLVLSKIKAFGLPIIIKPAKLGSSIGIQICKDEKDLRVKLDTAFEYDERLLIERYINIKKEVNIACFLNKGELIFSDTEEPIKQGDILNFKDKYQTENTGMQGMKRIMPAKISSDELQKIKDIAKLLYKELDMFGPVRFDFMMDENNQIFVNEVNTIPGSLANYLFDSIMPYSQLIEDMVTNAFIRNEHKSKIKTGFESSVLSQGFNGFKK